MAGKITRPLSGIITPMVTPLLDRDTLDVGGLERLVEHVLEGGVHGLFILGSTGEAPSLSYRLRYELIEKACRLVGGRIPVLVGVTDTAYQETLNVARKAADCGAAGVVLAPPYYFPTSQPEFLEYLRHLIPELPLPVLLYENPSHTKLGFEPETVSAVADMPNVLGLKDTSSNMGYFRHIQYLVRGLPEFSLMVGPEILLAEAVLMGGNGGVNGGSNVNPGLYVELYEAARAGEVSRVMSLHERVMQIRTTAYAVGKCKSNFIKGVKTALSLMGICGDAMAEPFQPFDDDARRIVRGHLEAAGIIV